MKTLQYFKSSIFTTKFLCFLTSILFFSLISSVSFAQHKAWITPLSAKAVKNPFKGANGSLADGKDLYTKNCTPCHGSKGKGDGPAAAALNPKPADHSSAAVQNETDGSLFWKLTTGLSPMPSYKTILSEKQRWELINYIRTLARNK